MIVDSKSSLESKSYRDRHPNLESECELTTTNRDEMANRLSLPCTVLDKIDELDLPDHDMF